MTFERPELFGLRDFSIFAVSCLLICFLSIAREYRDYKELTRFDDALVDATVVNQYVKQTGDRRYAVLKLKMPSGAVFYTSGSPSWRMLTGYTVKLRITTERLDFFGYMHGFYAPCKIVTVYPERSVRAKLSEHIASKYEDADEAQIYAALFTASPLDRTLREKLAALGVSHLLAISGFHLGVLSFVLYILLRPTAIRMQSLCCPYVNLRRELFIVVGVVLFGYLWFLEMVPSLLRAFAMMVVGFVLYDRGIRVVSMQTLSVTVMLLLSLWPRLCFSMGFWLSVGGVYAILLFLEHFGHWKKPLQFIGIHVWVYLMMLPMSIYLFGIFGSMHALSIIWSMLFILFYPLVMLVHVIGAEGFLHGLLKALLTGVTVSAVTLPGWVVAVQIPLAVGAAFRRELLWLLLGVSAAVFVSAVYQIA